MIFLDSWVFIEYFSENNNMRATELIENPDDTRVISSVVITEVKYVVAKKFGVSKASEVINVIQSLPNIRILPVTKEIAEFAAELRLKYYSRDRQISYIDTLNLATAIAVECSMLYTGDPDFNGINEITIKNIAGSKFGADKKLSKWTESRDRAKFR